MCEVYHFTAKNHLALITGTKDSSSQQADISDGMSGIWF